MRKLIYSLIATSQGFLSSDEICNKFIDGSLDQIQAGDIQMVCTEVAVSCTLASIT